MSDKEYPICHRCDLCNFQTREMNEFKKHIMSKEHHSVEAKEPKDSLAYFVYFGRGRDHIVTK